MRKISNRIPIIIVTTFLFVGYHGMTQSNADDNFFDPLAFGVVLDHPAMKDVVVKKDIVYLKDDKGALHIDIYIPPKLKANERKP